MFRSSSALVICAALILFNTVEKVWKASPLTNLIGFCQMCFLALPSPGQLLISLRLLFMMVESLNKRGRRRESRERIKRLLGWVGASRPNQVYCSGSSERDGFITHGISVRNCKFGVTLSSSNFPSHLFSVIYFIFVCVCHFSLLLVPVLQNPQADWLEYQ